MVSMNLILLILLLPPVLLLAFLVDKKTRVLLIFLAVGAVTAYISGQVNSAVNLAEQLDPFYISIHIAPIAEEFLKAFPVVLYLFVFDPDKKTATSCAAVTGLGFAVFENAWAFVQSVSGNPGWEEISFALSRGFGASLVHSLCTLILVYGITVCRKNKKLLFTGMVALFSLVCLFHSLFNVFVQSPYALAPFLLTIGGYLVLAALLYVNKKRYAGKKEPPKE